MYTRLCYPYHFTWIEFDCDVFSNFVSLFLCDAPFLCFSFLFFCSFSLSLFWLLWKCAVVRVHLLCVYGVFHIIFFGFFSTGVYAFCCVRLCVWESECFFIDGLLLLFQPLKFIACCSFFSCVCLIDVLLLKCTRMCFVSGCPFPKYIYWKADIRLRFV